MSVPIFEPYIRCGVSLICLGITAARHLDNYTEKRDMQKSGKAIFSNTERMPKGGFSPSMISSGSGESPTQELSYESQFPVKFPTTWIKIIPVLAPHDHGMVANVIHLYTALALTAYTILYSYIPV